MSLSVFQAQCLRLPRESAICNVYGSSADRANHKQHWQKYSSVQWPAKCRVLGCGSPARVGGHVFVRGDRSNERQWILPMCHRHNHDPNMQYGNNPGWTHVKVGSRVVSCQPHLNTFQ